MDILLIFLLVFSCTPFILWGDNWKKTAIGQIPLVVGAWFTFYQHMTAGIGTGEMLLWGIFFANIVYGHIAFTIVLLEMRKTVKQKQLLKKSIELSK
ncbi:hypothetical protein MUN88_20675 [Gracilibacillus caseinilyticus]|uniref:Holin n=1 Tax=Gracilibacillus caseinilyticus TaxID=2932256 RepID=A0ABY4F1U7_9BACI|nr:spore morphogenesis/germination protein YwcE [Gracilibacillus caseinilyticus]UOQ50663.1 hypothetical protein MUN88_20675 [Gracilibacillus caseinilyticus]